MLRLEREGPENQEIKCTLRKVDPLGMHVFPFYFYMRRILHLLSEGKGDTLTTGDTLLEFLDRHGPIHIARLDDQVGIMGIDAHICNVVSDTLMIDHDGKIAAADGAVDRYSKFGRTRKGLVSRLPPDAALLKSNLERVCLRVPSARPSPHGPPDGGRSIARGLRSRAASCDHGDRRNQSGTDPAHHRYTMSDIGQSIDPPTRLARQSPYL